jgi:hypothetical protein
MPDLEQLTQELGQVGTIADPTERLLEAAAIVAEAVADLDIQPVVVGGLALAYWTSGEIQTGDIDVVMPRAPQLRDRLAALGFELRGREWILPGAEISFEAPGDVLEPGDQSEPVELASGRHVLVLSLEDLLLWRLREWIHWHHASGFRQAAFLLGAEGLDAERLDTRAAVEGLGLALAELRRLVSDIEGGRVFEGWELVEIGRKLEAQGYSTDHE